MTDALAPSGGGGKAARSVVTPEGVVVFVRLASVSERVSALMIDLVILLVALVVIALASFFSGGYFGKMAGIVLLFVMRSFYFTGFELAWNGRTPGKRMTSLRVVNRRGGPLAPAAVIARNLMREVELFMPLSIALAGSAIADGPWTWLATAVWVGVLASLPLFNRDRLRAGDMIAGTWVVVEPRPVLLPDMAGAHGGPPRSPEESYEFTEPQLVVYGVKELQVLEEVLRSAGAERGTVRRDVAARIARKIGYSLPNPQDKEATRFLESFYAAQRRRLETELAFGRRRRDKNDR